MGKERAIRATAVAGHLSQKRQPDVTLPGCLSQSDATKQRGGACGEQEARTEPGTTKAIETREGRIGQSGKDPEKKGQEGLKPALGRVLCEISRYVVHAGSGPGVRLDCLQG